MGTLVNLYARGTGKGIELPGIETFQRLLKALVQPEELQQANNQPDRE